jgi:hypothetical protein
MRSAAASWRATQALCGVRMDVHAVADRDLQACGVIFDGTVDEARAAFGRQAWGVARAAYAAAAHQALTLDDIERYAIAAHFVGDEAASRELLARGYREASNSRT